MRGPIRRVVVLAALALLAGCTAKVHRVQLDPARLAGGTQVSVSCAYRMGEVADARPSTGNAGGLGKHFFLLEDAAGMVRQRLQGIGVSIEPTAPGERVDVRLLHLYMAQNTISKVPVMVLSVSVAGGPAVLVRSQKASMNWNGSEDEAYASYTRMFDDAMGQVAVALNKQCATVADTRQPGDALL